MTPTLLLNSKSPVKAPSRKQAHKQEDDLLRTGTTTSFGTTYIECASTHNIVGVCMGVHTQAQAVARA